MKRIPHEEAVTAADKVGADFRWLDLGDYLLSMTDVTVEQLVSIFQGVKPNIVLTYNPADPFNPDHPVACQMVQKARLLHHLAGELLAHSAVLHPLTCTFSNIINRNFVLSRTITNSSRSVMSP